MDYNEINTLAYGYIDRTDTETLARYDDFLRIVESKVNRVLKTGKMTERATMSTVVDQEYYALPVDYRSMRDLQINGTSQQGLSQVVTSQYRTPAQMNEFKNRPNIAQFDGSYYSIIVDQLHIQPTLAVNQTIEMVYYKKVNALSATVLTNWLGDEHPDCYVFGVATEITAFNKDYEASNLWNSRFYESIGEIKTEDSDNRWGSGDSLAIIAV